MGKEPNIVRVRDVDKFDLPLSRSTIYKLHSQKKFPKLIYSLPGAGLVFDLDEWQAMREAAQAGKSIR